MRWTVMDALLNYSRCFWKRLWIYQTFVLFSLDKVFLRLFYSVWHNGFFVPLLFDYIIAIKQSSFKLHLWLENTKNLSSKSFIYIIKIASFCSVITPIWITWVFLLYGQILCIVYINLTNVNLLGVPRKKTLGFVWSFSRRNVSG